MNLAEFDQMYVISDLHMGGPEGFQILRDTQRLADFIRWTGDELTNKGRVALVLNGDVIDTLAEDSGGYIATVNAQTIVRRIAEDKAFAPVWKALEDFIRCESRTLVIIIGNHNLELSFPGVQELILDRIAGPDPERRSRIKFSTSGAGYTCMVGDARVFCTHGNETDAWNYTRYEDLSKLTRRMNVGRNMAPGEWEPNAGTKMVKDVMNLVKTRYPWIDLLKPEKESAVGVLLALDPGQIKKIDKLLPVIGERIGSTGDVDRRLSADSYTPPAHSPVKSVDSLLGPNLKQGFTKDPGEIDSLADAMFAEAEKSYAGGTAATDPDDGTLGTAGYIWDRVTGWFRDIPPEEALRRALLDWLKDDTTFDMDNRDDTCRNIVDSVGSGIHFIVTGHTHLDRAIDLGGGRYYFNCGTWIRLIKFTKEILNNEKIFKEVYHLLENGSMEDIDKKKFNGIPFVLNHSSAVRIKAQGGRTMGELLHINDQNACGVPEIVKRFTR